MPYRGDIFTQGQYYHIYNRGAGKGKIFFSELFNAYVQALNLQHERTGTLFEVRFKHKRVDKWEYLIVLCRYIHLNPVRAGLVAKPEDWMYSNFREWIGRRDSPLVDKVFVQDHFLSAEEYVNFVNDVE